MNSASPPLHLSKTKSLLPPDGRSGHMLPKYGIEPAGLQHTSWVFFFSSKTHLFFFHLFKNDLAKELLYPVTSFSPKIYSTF